MSPAVHTVQDVEMLGKVTSTLHLAMFWAATHHAGIPSECAGLRHTLAKHPLSRILAAACNGNMHAYQMHGQEGQTGKG
jgi:hypothetical protein